MTETNFGRDEAERWREMAQRLDGFEQRLRRVEAQTSIVDNARESVRVRSDMTFVPQVAASAAKVSTVAPVPRVAEPDSEVKERTSAKKALEEARANHHSHRAGAWEASVWENVIGGRWALWVGVASLFLLWRCFWLIRGKRCRQRRRGRAWRWASAAARF